MSERRDFRITYYERQVQRLATHFRDLADQIERLSVPYSKPRVTGTPRHLAAAGQVNHALTWGIANAGAHNLFDAAYHADVAETEEEPADD